MLPFGKEVDRMNLEQTAIMRLRTASQLSLAYYRHRKLWALSRAGRINKL